MCCTDIFSSFLFWSLSLKMWFYKRGKFWAFAAVFSPAASLTEQTQTSSLVAANSVTVIRQTLKPELPLKEGNVIMIS